MSEQYQVVPRRRATADLRDAAAHYAREADPATARRFIDAVEQAFALLARQPEIGSPRHAVELDWPGLQAHPVQQSPSDDRPTADPIDRITTAAIFAAPVLLAASTIACSMESGMNRGAVGGVLQFYALSVLTIAIVALVAPLRPILPRATAVLLATGLLTGVFGASYGIDAIWAVTTGLPQLVDQDLFAGLLAMGPGALVLPVTFVGLGIAHARTGLAPAPAS